MGIGVDSARAGFALLKSDKSHNIQAHGIPEVLLKQAEAFLEKMPTELEDKLNKATTFFKKDTTVFLLTGEESHQKNVFAVLMLMVMLGAGKIVRYYIASSFDSHEHGQMAVVGVDLAKGLTATKLSAAIGTHLHSYKAIVLGGESLASIETALGKALFDLMTNKAIEVKIPAYRDKIVEI